MSEIHPVVKGKSISAYCIVILNTFRRDFVSRQWDLVPQTDVRQQHRLGRIVVVGKHARTSKKESLRIKLSGWKSADGFHWLDVPDVCTPLLNFAMSNEFETVWHSWHSKELQKSSPTGSLTSQSQDMPCQRRSSLLLWALLLDTQIFDYGSIQRPRKDVPKCLICRSMTFVLYDLVHSQNLGTWSRSLPSIFEQIRN